MRINAILAIISVGACSAADAWAQNYPSKLIRIIVPTSPPSATEITARVESVPDIPTVAEAGVPGYESLQWYGLLAPAATPKEIIARLYQETATILRTPNIRNRFAKDGAEVVASSPEKFGAFIRAETVKWAKVVKSADIQPE